MAENFPGWGVREARGTCPRPITSRQLQPLQNQQKTSPVTFSACVCILEVLNVVHSTLEQPPFLSGATIMVTADIV